MKSVELEKRMMERAGRAEVAITAESWFNHWHTHTDWDGYGNSSPEARRKALVALFLKFRAVLKEAQSYPSALQAYACIFPNSSNDLVALHSANEASKFPYGFEDVTWDIGDPQLMEGLINLELARLGQSWSEDGPVYWIVPFGREI